MRVLVTRPLEDARDIALRLEEHGHEAFIVPLLETHFFDGPELVLDDVQAILATSANGVRAIARRSSRRDIAIFAVGPQTAQTARAAGFRRVENADGDAVALAACVPRWADPAGGPLLHASGAASEGRLAAALMAKGFGVRTEILYEVQAARQFPANAANALRDGSLDAALFFSPRSARVFKELLAGEGLSAATEKLLAACISQATADALAPLRFRALQIAARPNQQALLACLD